MFLCLCSLTHTLVSLCNNSACLNVQVEPRRVEEFLLSHFFSSERTGHLLCIVQRSTLANASTLQDSVSRLAHTFSECLTVEPPNVNNASKS